MNEEKHFAPTPSRLAQARREGNVARSQELGSSLTFFAAILVLGAVVPDVAALAGDAIKLAAHGTIPAVPLFSMLALSFAPLLAAALSGAVTGLAQTGGLVVVAPSMKLARLSPLDGFKRMLSLETMTHGARALIVFSLAAGAVAASTRDIFAVATSGGAVLATADAAWNAARHCLLLVGAIGIVFGAFEYGIARRTWLRKLRMSFQELKRDVKEHDGDPRTRGRRRALHRSLIRGALANLDEASFVVVNPTHVAIALEYRPPVVPVPLVLVRAADEMALRVRERAASAGIPVIENVPLARALFADAREGEPIPGDHFVAVAEIVAALVRTGALNS